MGKAGLTGVHDPANWQHRLGAPENEPFPEPHERFSPNPRSDDLSAASEFAFKRYELKLLAALAQCYRGKIGLDKLPMIPLRMAELIIHAGGLGEWMNRDEKRLKRFWDMVREQSRELGRSRGPVGRGDSWVIACSKPLGRRGQIGPDRPLASRSRDR